MKYAFYILLLGLTVAFGYLIYQNIALLKVINEQESFFDSQDLPVTLLSHYSKNGTIFSIVFEIISILLIILFAYKQTKWTFILFNANLLINFYDSYNMEVMNFFRGHGTYPIIELSNAAIILLTFLIYAALFLSFKSKQIELNYRDFFMQFMAIALYLAFKRFGIHWFVS